MLFFWLSALDSPLSTDDSVGQESNLHCTRRVGYQGQRPLILYSHEGLDQELIVPSAAASFHREAGFSRMLFEER